MAFVSLVVTDGERALAPYRTVVAAHPDLRFELVVVRDGPAAQAVSLDGAGPGETVRVVRLARRFGAYATLCAGLAVARGDAVLVLDPARPEVAPPLLSAWRSGHDVVWAQPPAVRGLRALARRVPGLPVTPGERRPAMLADRAVLDAVQAGSRRPRDVVDAIARAGQRQATVAVAPQAAPPPGLARRARHALGWLAGLYSAPFLLLLLVGLAVAAVGAVAGAALVAIALVGSAKDWALVVAAVLFVGGLNVATLGGFGEYLWRAGPRDRAGYVLAGVHDHGPPPGQA